jgi:chaperone BCS1
MQKSDFFRAWFWNVHHIRAFIIQAYNIHHDKSETDLHIYNHTYVLCICPSDVCRPKVANWEGPVSRPSRPWSSVILPKGVKENLLKDVKNFVSEEEKSWYSSKGETGFPYTL